MACPAVQHWNSVSGSNLPFTTCQAHQCKRPACRRRLHTLQPPSGQFSRPLLQKRQKSAERTSPWQIRFYTVSFRQNLHLKFDGLYTPCWTHPIWCHVPKVPDQHCCDQNCQECANALWMQPTCTACPRFNWGVIHWKNCHAECQSMPRVSSCSTWFWPVTSQKNCKWKEAATWVRGKALYHKQAILNNTDLGSPQRNRESSRKGWNKSSHEPRHVVLCPSFRVQKKTCELHSHGSPICSKLHRTPGCAGCIMGGFPEVSWVNGDHHLGWMRRVKPATKWPVSMWLLYHIWLIWPWSRPSMQKEAERKNWWKLSGRLLANHAPTYNADSHSRCASRGIGAWATCPVLITTWGVTARQRENFSECVWVKNKVPIQPENWFIFGVQKRSSIHFWWLEKWASRWIGAGSFVGHAGRSL